MLRNDIIIYQDIAPLPLMQHADLIRDPRQRSQVLLRDRRPVPEQLLRDVPPGSRVDPHVLVVRGQPGKQGGQIRARLRADGGEAVGQDDAVVGPFPRGVLAAAVPRDLRFDLSALGRFVIAVPDLLSKSLL